MSWSRRRKARRVRVAVALALLASPAAAPAGSARASSGPEPSTTSAPVPADQCLLPCTEDFDDGDFDHASLSGLWHVSGACTPAPNTSKVLAFNRDATCDYTSWQEDDPIEARLRVDLSGATSAYLRFDEIHEVEQFETWDRLSVVAGTGTRETMLIGPKYARPHPAKWRTVGLDLASVAGEPDAWIAWRFDPVDRTLNATLGWLIDNVRIDAEPLCTGNDARAAACTVSTLPYANHQWTGGFTAEEDEDRACAYGASTAWYRYEHSTAARSVRVDTRASTYPVNVSVFLGSTLVACESPDLKRAFDRANYGESFFGIPGATYDVRISGPPQQPGYLLVEIR